MHRPGPCAVALLLLTTAALAAGVPEYELLREARPDGRRVAVDNLTLTRDVHRLTFTSGTFHLLAPVNGRTFGAVFIGKGQYVLDPATVGERYHLRLVTGEKNLEQLTDTFDELVVLFSDKTAEELEAHASMASGTPEPLAGAVYEQHLKQQRSKYRLNLHLRILQDFLNGTDGFFVAAVDGERFAPSLVLFDPSGIGNLAAQLSMMGGEESALLCFDEVRGGLWYLSARKGQAKEGRGKPLNGPVDALHYEIDTTIASDLQINGVTTLRLQPRTEGLRVLPLHILPKLRIKSAALISSDGTKVEAGIVQEDAQLGKFARLFKEEVADTDAAVVFPSPLKAGQTVELSVSYEGRDVLQGVDVDSYAVGARESWYPNSGTFSDTATYTLTFRHPKRNSLVGVGKLQRDEMDGNQRLTVWKSDQPMRVAGFNYGRFEKISRNDEPSRMQIDVYTNRERRKMAEDSMADAINAARTATAFFGKAPFSPVSVTQQAQWNFGQSWPSLVFLPTLALTSSTEQVMMFEAAGPAVWQINEFAKMVGWHEMAHQWWGHLVGWESYRDQWLSEGFAEFTAAVVLQFTEGLQKYDDFWERRRSSILERRAGGISSNEAGAITQGFRLATHRAPGAAQDLIYGKGAFVLHMLRMAMRDSSTRNPDEKFVRMMSDFVASYSGKNPSTADFQKVVERHMTPMLNLAGDGTMDYFFDQWVRGMEVPRLKSTLTAQQKSEGTYAISGVVSQEEVSSSFRTLVPIYVELGKGEQAKIGAVRLVGTASQPVNVEIKLPKPPKRVVINALHDVLAR